MKNIKYVISFLLVSLLFVVPVKADNEIAISNSQKYDSNAAIVETGDVISKTKNVLGSSIVTGGDVTSTGVVDGVLVSAGNTVSSKGTSEYGLFAGNHVTVSGNVLKDSLVAGNVISLDSKSTFGRDLFIFGSDVTLSGSISRNVVIYASKVNVDHAMITGDAKIICSNLNINDDVKIDGKLSYNNSKNTNVVISDKAQIASTQTLSTNEVSYNNTYDNIIMSLVGYINVLVVFAVLALLKPSMLKNIDDEEFNFRNFISNCGIGLAVVIIAPLLFLTLFMVYVGSLLAVILLALLILCSLLANIYCGYYVGRYIWNKLIKKQNNNLLVGLIGISLLYLLSLIPVLGVITAVLSFTCGLGLVLTKLKKM